MTSLPAGNASFLGAARLEGETHIRVFWRIALAGVRNAENGGEEKYQKHPIYQINNACENG